MDPTELREDFAERGMLRLPAAVAAHSADQMRDRVWQHLEQSLDALPGRPDTWPAAAPAHFQALTRSGAFGGLASPAVLGAVDALLGHGTWQAPESWGRPLVTFPQPGPWRVPARGWHIDSSDRPADPVLVLFACLGRLDRGGGGTLVVTGSHRLTTAGRRYAGLRSARVRDRLAEDHPWLRDLLAPGDEPDRTARLLRSGCTIDGIELALEELTGTAGDAFLMHPRLLHAVAPNALEVPRLMLLHFVQRRVDDAPGDRGPA